MKNYSAICDYFLELSHPDRLHIIDLLFEKDSRVSELAKTLGVTAQETHRNLSRLLQYGLVEKTVDGKYKITEVGKILSSISSLPQFVHTNKSFFDDHYLGHLPKKFIKRIGALSDCDQVTGISCVLEKWKSIYKNADEFIYDITTDSLSDFDTVIMNKVKNGAFYRHMISKNHREESERATKLEELGFYSALEKKQIQRKIMDSVEFMIILNEHESAVVFPDKSNNPDLRTMFYGKNHHFYDWCFDLYEYYWKKGKSSIRKPAIMITKNV